MATSDNHLLSLSISHNSELVCLKIYNFKNNYLKINFTLVLQGPKESPGLHISIQHKKGKHF